jgi:hypothetical protein
MFYGGFNNQMQLMGLLYLMMNQESDSLSLPHSGVRQKMANGIRHLGAAFRGPADIKLQLLALSDANQTLDARVAELERQLAMVTATQT